MSVMDDLDEEYEKLVDGEEVEYGVAVNYYKENDGFMKRTETPEEVRDKGEGETAVGMHLVEDGINVAFLELRREDGKLYAQEKEQIVIVVDGRTKHNLIQLVKNAYKPKAASRKSSEEDSSEGGSPRNKTDYIA